MILLLLSDDKLCARAWSQLQTLPKSMMPVPVLVKTDMVARTFRMLRRGTLRSRYLVRMLVAEFGRQSFPNVAFEHVVQSSGELEALVDETKPSLCLMYRCGLIIEAPLLSSCRFLNIHSASIPEYGGIASIGRAIDDGAFRQVSTCHEVTKRIDEGAVVDTEPYEMQSTLSYRENEDIAYAAGERLLLRMLQSMQR